MVYLDYNATTPVDHRVFEAMRPYLTEIFGNPSSLHGLGARSKRAIEEAREKITETLRCRSSEFVFTSGGTESINLALQGVVESCWEKELRPVHVVTTAVEHSAVLKTLEWLEKRNRVEVTHLPVDELGTLSLETLEQTLRPDTRLLSVQFANNEIGNIYPIPAIGRVARERGILFHVDAVQALGKLRMDLSKLPVDLMSFSAHKIYGPKGVGGLYIRKGTPIESLLHGGSQEGERRGGTENLAGIVGFGEAVAVIHEGLEGEMDRQKRLRDRLQARLLEKVSGVFIHGDDEARLANTLNVSFEGIDRETVLIALDREGIAVSAGSACASGALEPSHVLLAMGVPHAQAKGAVRFSLGRGTTDDDIDYVLEKVPEVIERLRC